MYCSNCGAKVTGNFCSQCGHRLAGEAQDAAPATNWKQETRYEVLIRHPDVRARLAQSSTSAKQGVTGEQCLELFDKLASNPIPLAKMAKLVQPLYAQLGVRTGKSRSGVVQSPIGEAIVDVLCSLARSGQTVRRVNQLDDGCEIEAVLPSDLFALEGDLAILVRQRGEGTIVEAATKISGQWIDWGKSTRCLTRLFEDVRAT